MGNYVHEIVLVFTVICILLILVHIFLDYKWYLDILHKMDTKFETVNQRYRNENTNKLSSISDEVQRFTRDWESDSSRNQSRCDESRDDRTLRAMDDLFDRYGD